MAHMAVEQLSTTMKKIYTSVGSRSGNYEFKMAEDDLDKDKLTRFNLNRTSKDLASLKLSYDGIDPNSSLFLNFGTGKVWKTCNEDCPNAPDYYGTLRNLGLDDEKITSPLDQFSLNYIQNLPTFSNSGLGTIIAAPVNNLPLPILPTILQKTTSNDGTFKKSQTETWRSTIFVDSAYGDVQNQGYCGRKNGQRYGFTNGLPSRKGASKYSTYPLAETQILSKEIVFFISAKHFHYGWNPMLFSVRIDSVAQISPIVKVANDKIKPTTRFMCTFHTNSAGQHLIHVIHNESLQHIDGSPLTIEISKELAIPTKEKAYQNQNVSSYIHTATRFRATFSKLWGITYDPIRKEVYAADRHGSEVLRFSILNGKLELNLKYQLPIGKDFPDVFHPTGISLDTVHQRLYVTDKGNHCVVIFSITGEFISSFGKQGYKNGEFSYPWGVGVSPNGKLVVVADSKNHRIQLFKTSGEFIRKFSVFENNPYQYRKEFDQPRGISFDHNGSRIFTSDFNVAKLFRFDLNLVAKRDFGPPRILVRPQGLTVDHVTGNVMICDSRKNVIRLLNSCGDLIGTISKFEGDALEMPIGACACDEYILVVDRGGMRIRIIK